MSTLTARSTPSAPQNAMSTPNHQSAQRTYTRELVVLALCAPLAGLVASGLQVIATGHAWPLTALSFCALLGVGASFLDYREGSSTIRVILGVIGGLLMVALSGVSPLLAAGVGGSFVGAALSWRPEESLLKTVGFSSLYGIALAIGVFIATMMTSPGTTLGQIPVLRDVVGTMLWGVVMMLPGGARLGQWQQDEIMAEFKGLRAEVKGPSREAIDGAMATYERITQELERETHAGLRTRAMSVAQEISRALIALTRRAQELGRTSERMSTNALEIRAKSLMGRIHASKDKALRRELHAAHEEILEQIIARRRIQVACVRVEARQQRFLTALDRLYVTLVQHDTLSASQGAVSESLDDLSRITEEVHWQNLSVDELCGDDESDSSDASDDLDELLEPSAGVVLDLEATTAHSASDESNSDAVTLHLDEEPGGVDGSLDSQSTSSPQGAHVASSTSSRD